MGGGHFAAVAGYAVFAYEGFYGLVELLVDIGGGRGGGGVRQGGCGEGEGEEKGPKLHQKAPLASELGGEMGRIHDTYSGAKVLSA